MDFRFSSKRDLYYEKAMKLYFQEGMRVTQISRALPISRAILYKWIAIFAEQNPQMASMKGVKQIKKVSKPSPEAQAEELPKTVMELQAELKRLRAQLKKAEIKEFRRQEDNDNQKDTSEQLLGSGLLDHAKQSVKDVCNNNDINDVRYPYA